jgi:hypothetical protein
MILSEMLESLPNLCWYQWKSLFPSCLAGVDCFLYKSFLLCFVCLCVWIISWSFSWEKVDFWKSYFFSPVLDGISESVAYLCERYVSLKENTANSQLCCSLSPSVPTQFVLFYSSYVYFIWSFKGLGCFQQEE